MRPDGDEIPMLPEPLGSFRQNSVQMRHGGRSPERLRTSNTQDPTSNGASGCVGGFFYRILDVRCWVLDVLPWMFLSFPSPRRLKSAIFPTHESPSPRRLPAPSPQTNPLFQRRPGTPRPCPVRPCRRRRRRRPPISHPP